MNSLQSGGELNTNLRAYYDDSSGFRPESYDEPFEKKFFPDDKIKKKNADISIMEGRNISFLLITGEGS